MIGERTVRVTAIKTASESVLHKLPGEKQSSLQVYNGLVSVWSHREWGTAFICLLRYSPLLSLEEFLFEG